MQRKQKNTYFFNNQVQNIHQYQCRHYPSHNGTNWSTDGLGCFTSPERDDRYCHTPVPQWAPPLRPNNRVNPRFVSESLRSIPLYGALQASTDENQICDDAPHTDRAPPGSTQPCGNCRSFANPIKVRNKCALMMVHLERYLRRRHRVGRRGHGWLERNY